MGKLESSIGAWLFTNFIGHDERHEVVVGCVTLELKEPVDKNVLCDAMKLDNTGRPGNECRWRRGTKTTSGALQGYEGEE